MLLRTGPRRKVRRVLSPQGDDAFQGEPVGPEDIVNALGGTEAWGKTNWTEQWLELVDEDPTVRFTHIEYVADTSEVGPAFCVCSG